MRLSNLHWIPHCPPFARSFFVDALANAIPISGSALTRIPGSGSALRAFLAQKPIKTRARCRARKPVCECSASRDRENR